MTTKSFVFACLLIAASRAPASAGPASARACLDEAAAAGSLTGCQNEGGATGSSVVDPRANDQAATSRHRGLRLGNPIIGAAHGGAAGFVRVTDFVVNGHGTRFRGADGDPVMAGFLIFPALAAGLVAGIFGAVAGSIAETAKKGSTDSWEPGDKDLSGN